MDPLELRVAADPNSTAPQFLSVTLLPGLGTSVLQITANLPGIGPTPLLAAPTVDDLVNGRTNGPTGFNDDHGAIEFPWGGELVGSLTPVGSSIQIPWLGKQIEASTESSAHSGFAEGGLLWTQSADSVGKPTLGVNPSVAVVYHGINGDDHWPSKSDVTVNAQLTSTAFELTLDVKNAGETAEPVGVGWHPRFLLPAGGRKDAMVEIPTGSRMQVTPQSLPTGNFEPMSASDRFMTHPAPLGAALVDETIALTKASGVDAGLTLLSPAAGFGIRMLPLSGSIKALRAYSPGDANYVSLGVQTNMDDPFGRVWTSPTAAGMVTLQPGETFQWKVRLEIFALPKP